MYKKFLEVCKRFASFIQKEVFICREYEYYGFEAILSEIKVFTYCGLKSADISRILMISVAKRDAANVLYYLLFFLFFGFISGNGSAKFSSSSSFLRILLPASGSSNSV
jgi:hypothetical protein